MCGIVGAISLNHKTVNIQSTFNMLEKLAHRGPDDAGYLYFHTGCRHKGFSFYLNLSDKRFTQYAPLIPDLQNESVQRELNHHDWDLFLGHRRLAIIDISEAGHQPMSDLSKNLWIVYNGEIYNFLEIKKELEQKHYTFQSHTDTEVIIYAFAEWGIKAINKFNGMFAFALFDNFRKKLYLVRDRYGIKPLYYSIVKEPQGYTLLFASEIKSLMQYKFFNKEIDYDGLIEYFSFQNFFSDRTLWKDVKILLPGHFIEIDLNTQGKSGLEVSSRHKGLMSGISNMQDIFSKSNLFARIVQFWDFEPFCKKHNTTEKELIEQLREIFESSVKKQLISDVEVGSYLSGGIDSGSITAIASKYFQDKKQSFKTFTIGFDLHSASGIELNFDERQKAEHMSYFFGTEHYEMVLKAGDMERCFTDLVYHLEESRVGQSYPNYYASMLASKFVKVVLSGCGGDELFAGYPWRYYHIYNVKNFEEFIDRYFKFWLRLFSENELKKVFNPIKGKYSIEPREIFKAVIPEDYRNKKFSRTEFLELALYFEQKTFLHGLLIVEDKLSMAHSLETRVPFLDNDLVDFAQKIPVNLKLSNLEKINRVNENEIRKTQKTNDGKAILRKAMKKYIPEKIYKAVKQGFSSPDSSWFRGESIDFVKAKLLNDDANIYNYMDKYAIKRLIFEHLNGEQNRRLLIWSLLNFEEWCDIYMNKGV